MKKAPKFFENIEAKNKYLNIKSKQADDKIQKAKRKANVAKRIADIESVPRSIVFHRGSIGVELKSLVKDFRQSVMMPFTAKDVKIGDSSNIEGIKRVAADIWVSHLVMFRSLESGPQLRYDYYITLREKKNNQKTLFFCC